MREKRIVHICTPPRETTAIDLIMVSSLITGDNPRAARPSNLSHERNSRQHSTDPMRPSASMISQRPSPLVSIAAIMATYSQAPPRDPLRYILSMYM